MPDARTAAELHATERNVLLRLLDDADYAWVAGSMDEIVTKCGAVLAAAGERTDHVYFPQSGVISLVTDFQSGGSVEAGTVGCEGMVGIGEYLEAEASPSRVQTQIDAVLRRVPTTEFLAGLRERPAADRIIRRYVDAYIVQLSQTAGCNRMHDLAPRAARWLLLTHDRVGASTFALTHEFLAMMLGVRRAGVSEAAADLQRAGAIRYSRGRVTVIDRAILEQRSCECYGVVRARFDALLEAGAAGPG